MKKQLVATGIAAAVGVTSLAGIGVAKAATDTSSSSNPMSSLVEAIATKFNLSESEVQSVFDEQRDKMEAEREAKIKEKVAQLVTDGKITQAQADKINAKRGELKAERDANKDSSDTKTREEMKSEREAKRTELEAWAKENGIDTEYLRYVMGGGRGHGGPGILRDRMKSDSSSDSSTSTNSTE